MAALRTAIVGAGLMGGWHARYAAREDAEIAAVVDPNPKAAEALARRFPGASSFATLPDCLAESAAEVVHVCTGLASHVPLAEAALQAGRHVLVEKPLAPGSAGVRRLVDLAQRARLRLGVVHQMPFARGFLRLRRELPALGRLVRIAYTAATAGAGDREGAERRAVLLEILPHPVSLFRALLGDAAEPSWKILGFTDDDLEMAGRHGETRLSIVISLRARPTRNELALMGTEAAASVDLYHGYAVIDRAGVSRASKVAAPFRAGSRLLAAAGINLLRRTASREPAYPGLRELIRRFYASVRDGGAGPVSFEEMIETAVLMERASSSVHRERQQSSG